MDQFQEEIVTAGSWTGLTTELFDFHEAGNRFIVHSVYFLHSLVQISEVSCNLSARYSIENSCLVDISNQMRSYGYNSQRETCCFVLAVQQNL